MNDFLEVGLNNAIFATGLAALIALAARLRVKAGMLHALWVIVLLKLITPPLIPIDLANRKSGVRQRTPPRAVAESHQRSGPTDQYLTELDGAAPTSRLRNAPPLVLPLAPPAALPTGGLIVASENTAGVHRAPTPQQGSNGQSRSANPSWLSAPVVLQLAPFWAYVWLAGTAICLCVVGARVRTFHKYLSLCSPAQDELREEVEQLAKRVGLRRPPLVLIVPGRIAPMLWAFGARPRLIYPSALLGRLDRAARATLLLHELSHLRRGDHRIRWLEVAVTALYWWFPVVWWVRRRLHEAEEECCDGFVLSELPGSRETYANALLTAIAEVPSRAAWLPIASGIGDFESIKRRLTGIMLGPEQRGLSRPARVAVLCIALILMPLLPSLAHVEQSPPTNGTADVTSVELQPAQVTFHREIVTFDGPQRNVDGTERLVPPSATIRIPHASAVVALFSPDSGMLLVGDNRGALQFWNLYSGEVAREISSGPGLDSAAFSPDGEFVATGHTDGSLRLWRVENGSARRTVIADGALTSLEFTPDGRLLIGSVESPNRGSQVQVWDSRNLRVVRSVAHDHQQAGTAALDAGQSAVFVTGSPEHPERHGKSVVCDLRTGDVADLGLPPADFTAVSAQREGHIVAVADKDGLIHIWDRRRNSVRSIMHSAAAMDLAVSHRGDMLALIDAEGRVAVRDIATGSPGFQFEGHHRPSHRPSPGDLRYSVEFSRDDSAVVSTGPDGLVKIWTLKGAPPHRSIQADAYLYSLAVSPDGRLLLAGGSEGASLWDLSENRLIRRFSERGKAIATAISPDGQRALSGGENGSLFLWDLETGELIRRFDGHTAEVRSIAFSPDGRQAASCSYDQLAIVWEVDTGRGLQRLAGHRDRVNAVAFSPNGRLLATGDTFSLRIWTLETSQQLVRVPTTSPVGAVAFSPSGDQVLAGLNDGSVRLWDVGSGRELQHFRGHSGPLEAVGFSPDGRYAVSAGQDKQVLVWSASRSGPAFQLAAGASTIKSARFTPDGRRLITAGADGCIRIWDVAAVPETATLAHYIRQWGRSAGVPRVSRIEARRTIVADARRTSFVQFSPDGGLLATGGSDGTVRFWDVRTCEPAFELNGHASGITSGAFASDGRYLVTGSWGPENVVRVWDVQNREPLSVLRGHSAPIRDIAVSPNGRHIAAGSEDGTVRLWDLQTAEPIAIALQQALPVFSVAFSPDGQTLAAGTGGLEPYRPGQIFLCDLTGSPDVQCIDGFLALQSDLTFSPDGRFLAAKKRENAICLRDLALNCEVLEIRGTAGPLAYAPDGDLIASGHLNGSIQLWSTASGHVIAELCGHDAQVRDLAIAPDGKTLAAAAEDGLVQLWDLP